MSQRYLLVDGQNIAHVVDKLPQFRIKRENGVLDQLRAPNNELVTVLKGTLNMIGSMLGKMGPHQVIVGYDGQGQTWRLGLDPLYKGGPKRIKELDVTDPQEAINYLVGKFTRPGQTEKEVIINQNRARDMVEFRIQMKRLPEHLKAFGVKVMEFPTLEGDDIVALLSEHEAIKEHDKLLYSNDRDLLAYVGPKSKYYSPTAVTTVTTQNFQDYVNRVFKFKGPMTPAEWPLFRALVGDRQDNITGVHNCGPATAGKLVAGLVEAGARFTGYQQPTDEVITQIVALRDKLPKPLREILSIEQNIKDLEHFYGLVRVANAPEQEKKAVLTSNVEIEASVSEDQITDKLKELGFKQWLDDKRWINRFTSAPQVEMGL